MAKSVITFVILWAASPTFGQTPSYVITTGAGGANPYYYAGTGDGGLATSAGLGTFVYDVSIDNAENLYIVAGPLIRKVTPQGSISTVAGGGSSVGDFVPATQAQLAPLAIASDPAGNLYIADTAFGNFRIRKVDTTGVIATVAGGAPCCDLGDGGSATAAYLGIPYGLALDSAGNLYVAQAGGQIGVIRKISSDGSISTVAGGGTSTGDGEATSASLSQPVGVALDAQGNIYIAEAGANRIRKVSSAGVISTIAGSGAANNGGNGGPALQAGIDNPWHLAVDSSGNTYVTQIADARVRLVSSGGTILTLAGSGSNGSSGDGGPAAAGTVDNPAGIIVGATGQIYFAQASATVGRIRLLTPGSSSNPSGCTGTYTISGQVTLSGGALPSVTLTLSGSSNTGTQTDSTGAYSFSGLPCGGNYTITPTLTGYTFAPPSLVFSGLTATQTGANFAASKTNVVSSLSVSPTALSFSYQVSTSAPASPVVVSSSGGPSSFTATAQTLTPAGVNWLAVNPSSGTTPATLTVSLVSTSSLVPGTYTGSVTVSLPDGTAAQVVNVMLTVGAAFDVQTPALQFTISNGSAPNQSVLVTNLSPQDLTVTAASHNQYISITPKQVVISANSGNRQSQFVLTPMPSSLPGGLLNYADSLVLSAAGQSLSFPVSISLSNQSGQPLLSSTAVVLYTTAGTNDHDNTQVQLLNAGTSPLDFYVSLLDDWIDVSPSAPVCNTPPSCQNVLLAPQQIQPLTVETNDNVTESTLQPQQPQTSAVFSTSATVRYGTAADVVTVYLDVLPTGSPLPPTANFAGVLVGLPGQVAPTVTLSNYLTNAASFTISAPSWLPVTAPASQIPAAARNNTPGPGTLDLTIGPPSRVPTADELATASQIQLTFPGVPIKSNNSNSNDVCTDPNYYVLCIQTVYAGSTSSQNSNSARKLEKSSKAAATSSCTPSQLSAVFASPASQFQATAGLPVSLIAQIADDCGNVPTQGTALVTFTSGESPLSLTRWPDGLWRGTWQPQVPQTGLVTLLLSAGSPTIATPTQAFVTGTVTGSSGVPVVMSKSVVDAASQQVRSDTLTPGEIISIYGTNLASQIVSAAGLPLTQLGSVQVTAGGTLLPLFFVSPSQINAVVPSTLTIGQTVQLVVTQNGVPSVPLPMTVVSERPGIFTQSATGSGAGSIIDNGTPAQPTSYTVDATHPAHAGDIISIYSTGLGPVNPPVDVSQPAPSSPLSQVTGQVSAIIGNSSAEVIFAGVAPGFSGLYQVNAQVPSNLQPGNAAVQISVNNIPSNGVGLVVK